MSAVIGSYAFLVSDEGVKISAYSPETRLIVPGMAPLITSTIASSAQDKLRSAVESYAGRLPEIISFEHLSVLPSLSPLTQSVLQDNFHHATLTHLTLSGSRITPAR